MITTSVEFQPESEDQFVGFRDRMHRLAHAIVWAQRHIRGKLYEPDVALAAKLLRPNDVALDVGAHSGTWTVALSKLLNGGHIYSIEALPYYADVLRLTLSILGRHNVTVLNKAANDTGEAVALVWKGVDGERLTGLTHIASSDEQTEGTANVAGLCLDTLLPSIEPRRIRFIKMDVEGAELLALRGAQAILEVHRPALYLEAWASHTERYGYSLAELFAFLEGLGYHAYMAGYGATPTPITASGYSGEGDLWFLTENDADLLTN